MYYREKRDKNRLICPVKSNLVPVVRRLSKISCSWSNMELQHLWIILLKGAMIK